MLECIFAEADLQELRRRLREQAVTREEKHMEVFV